VFILKKKTSSPEPVGQFQSNFLQIIFGVQNYTNKGAGHLQRGDNHKNTNFVWGHLNFFFSSKSSQPEAHIYMKAF
jgi:hypothetical protein